MIRRDTRLKKSKPYDKPETQRKSTGLFSKIKGIFTTSVDSSQQPEVVETKNSDQAKSVSMMAKSNFSTQDRTGNNNMPAMSFPNLSNITSDTENVTSRNPNETLAEFFSRKGDEPLSDIEVEGVMSLIGKANQQNKQLLQSSPLRFQNTNTSINNVSLNADNSLLNSTSNTILRPSNLKTPVKIQTPTYTPKSNYITRNSALQQTITRRIVNYSALPSPYRTRMSSPLTSFIDKKERMLEEAKRREEAQRKADSRVFTANGIDLNQLDAIGDDDTQQIPEKPISKTAAKVLSLLSNVVDNKDSSSKSSEPSNSIISKTKSIPTETQKQQLKEDIKESSTNKPLFRFRSKDDVPKSYLSPHASTPTAETKPIVSSFILPESKNRESQPHAPVLFSFSNKKSQNPNSTGDKPSKLFSSGKSNQEEVEVIELDSGSEKADDQLADEDEEDEDENEDEYEEDELDGDRDEDVEILEDDVEEIIDDEDEAMYADGSVDVSSIDKDEAKIKDEYTSEESESKLVNGKEVIEKFVFPEVSSPSEEYYEKNVKPIVEVQKISFEAAPSSSYTFANQNIASNGSSSTLLDNEPQTEVIDSFTFPDVGAADSVSLRLIDDDVVRLYDSVFKFDDIA